MSNVTVTLLKDVWISGTLQTAGSSVVVDRALAGAMITNGQAQKPTGWEAAEAGGQPAHFALDATGNIAGLVGPDGDSGPSSSSWLANHAAEHAAMGGPVLRYRLTGGAAGGVVQFSGTNKSGTVTVLDTFSLSANEVRTEVLWGDDSITISYTVTSGAVTVEGY